jgi:hypothetical protein
MSTCYQAGVAYTVDALGMAYQAQSPDQCRVTCQQVSNCAYWTFTVNDDGSGTCRRYAAAANGLPPASRLEARSFSGARDCKMLRSDVSLNQTNQQCYEIDVDYPGGDIHWYNERSPQRCQAACFTHPQCKIWVTIFPETQSGSILCGLKSEAAIGSRGIFPRRVSGRIDNCRMSRLVARPWHCRDCLPTKNACLANLGRLHLFLFLMGLFRGKLKVKCILLEASLA